MQKNYFNNRKFKFWYYHITHKEALFRSEKDKYFDNNVDIYFGAIEYMEISTDLLSELQLEKAKDEDVLYLSKKIGKEVSSDNITVLLSGKQRFYVVASVVKIIENTLERMELPFYTFMKCAENGIM